MIGGQDKKVELMHVLKERGWQCDGEGDLEGERTRRETLFENSDKSVVAFAPKLF